MVRAPESRLCRGGSGPWVVRDRGLPVILISHNIPHVFEIADRIHIQRLGKRPVITPQSHTMSEAAAITTGAAEPPPPVG